MAAASKKFMEASEEEKNAPDFMKTHSGLMKLAMHESFIRDSLFIVSHSDSYLSLYLISNTVSSTPYNVLDTRLKALSTPLQNTYLAKEVQKVINVLKSRAVGGIAPDFTLNDAGDKPVALSSFRGKYVLLDFWASWCVPCRKENPNLKIAYEKFRNKKFTIVSVSLDRPSARDKWLAAIKNDGLSWPQLCDLSGGDGQVEVKYNITSIPMNFLIDPQGKILAINLRGEELQRKLAEIIL
jgi:thiol-disulfide isomerase/thioredoxin